MPHALIADTFEQSQQTPVVRHLFVGPTARKARGFYKAHLKADSFLRECTERGSFKGRFPCHTKLRMTEVSPRQLTALRTQQLAGVSKQSDVGACPPPSFWRFAAVVVMGQVSAFGMGYLLKHLLRDQPRRKADTVMMVGSLATFWTASGAAWLLLQRTEPDTRSEPEARVTVPGAPVAKEQAA